jgi:hypothetical protein
MTEAKLEISRERITQHVAQLALHGKSEMVQLKAIEVLNKMQGYNEPASVQHNHVHLQVDAALIEELRSGYAQLAERSAKACCPCRTGRCRRRAQAGGYASQEEGR